MVLACTTSAQLDISKLHRTWKSWNRAATQETIAVKTRLQKAARKLSHGWDSLSSSEQVVIAKEIWALRNQIDLLSWIGSDDAAKHLGMDIRSVRLLADGLKVAVQRIRAHRI